MRSFLFRPASCSSGWELLRHRAAAQLIPSCLVRPMSRWIDHFACRASVPVATAKRVKSPYRPAPVRRAWSHERSPNGKYEWLTPPDLTRALGELDLDPCPSRALPQPESAITTGPNHPLPRQDLHLQACQRPKAAHRNLPYGSVLMTTPTKGRGARVALAPWRRWKWNNVTRHCHRPEPCGDAHCMLWRSSTSTWSNASTRMIPSRGNSRSSMT